MGGKKGKNQVEEDDIGGGGGGGGDEFDDVDEWSVVAKKKGNNSNSNKHQQQQQHVRYKKLNKEQERQFHKEKHRHQDVDREEMRIQKRMAKSSRVNPSRPRVAQLPPVNATLSRAPWMTSSPAAVSAASTTAKTATTSTTSTPSNNVPLFKLDKFADIISEKARNAARKVTGAHSDGGVISGASDISCLDLDVLRKVLQEPLIIPADPSEIANSKMMQASPAIQNRFIKAVLSHLPYVALKQLAAQKRLAKSDGAPRFNFIDVAAAGKNNKEIVTKEPWEGNITGDVVNESLLRWDMGLRRAWMLAKTEEKSSASNLIHAATKQTREAAISVFSSMKNSSSSSSYVKFSDTAKVFCDQWANKSLFTSRLLNEEEKQHPVLIPAEANHQKSWETTSALAAVNSKGRGSGAKLAFEDDLSHHITTAMSQVQNLSIVPTLSQFKRNFRVFHGGLLDGVLEPGKVFIGGSTLLACLQKQPTAILRQQLHEDARQAVVVNFLPILPARLRRHIWSLVEEMEFREYQKYMVDRYRPPLRSASQYVKSWFSVSKKFVSVPAEGANIFHCLGALYDRDDHPFAQADLDVMMIVPSLEEAKKVTTEVYHKVLENLDTIDVAHRVVRTDNAVTILTECPMRKVQIVSILFSDLSEALPFIDLDCTSVVFDGVSVECSHRFTRAVNTSSNFLSPSILKTSTTRDRVEKYAKRGFSPLIFELCKHKPRCDVAVDPDLLQAFREASSTRLPKRFREVAYQRALKSLPSTDLQRAPGGAAGGATTGNDTASSPAAPTPAAAAGAGAAGGEDDARSETSAGTNDSRPILKSTQYYFETYFSMSFDRFRPLYEFDSKLERMALNSRIAFAYGDRLDDVLADDVPQQPTAAAAATTDSASSWIDESNLQDNNNNAAPSWDIQTTVVPPPRHRSSTPFVGFRWKALVTVGKKNSPMFFPQCYMCKERTLPDETAGSVVVCIKCAELNRTKREDKVPLSGKVALVTGGRIKIGFAVALKLLKCGATVIVFTRFPNDAAARFASQPESGEWKQRDALHIYGVDFRDLSSLTSATNAVLQKFSHLDILINNAAQTVRRPPAYYRDLVLREREIFLQGNVASFVKSIGFSTGNEATLAQIASSPSLSSKLLLLCDAPAEEAESVGGGGGGQKKKQSSSSTTALVATSHDFLQHSSAVLCLRPLIPGDDQDSDENGVAHFPSGLTASDGEQLDLRPETSWNAKIDAVHPLELVEANVVNSVAPFMLIQSLTPLMQAPRKKSFASAAGKPSTPSSSSSFIVNVSSPEGQFSSDKTGEHAHTNMAKAAMNMITRSIARDYALKNIFVTSADTGWVSRMRPGVESIVSDRPPLSEEDGAARILDPVFEGYRATSKGAAPISGVLLQHFQVAPW